MTTKPPRSKVGVVGGIDELLTLPIHSPSHGEGCPDTTLSATQAYASPQGTRPDVKRSANLKRQRTPESSAGVSSRSSSSASPSSLYRTGDSVGGDELDLLRRKDEELADMALFLAKAVGETSSRRSLAELVGLFDRLGISRVMMALRRVGGGLAIFVGNLHQATFPMGKERSIAIKLFCGLMGHVNAEALFQECVVNFLVKSLQPEDIQGAPTVLRRRTVSHWSVRSKQNDAVHQPSPNTPDAMEDDLEAKVEKLCGSTVESSGGSDAKSSASLALWSLLTLMFAYNSHPHVAAQRHVSVPLLFAQAGGLEQLSQLLICRNTQERALALLEVLTATEELRGQSHRLLALVSALVAQLDVSRVQVPVLKVLTNITNILPHAFTSTGTATAFAQFALLSLLRPQAPCTPDETEIFALCCAINVVKYESKATGSSDAHLSSAFAASQSTLVSFAESMMESHRCNSTEQLVRSGYYALLLGALSLVPVAEEEGRTTLRVPVMTAVARASGGTSADRKATRQPMRLVVAIIQEFLLFQSSAGTLTKETLLEMSALVDRIVISNHIDVVPEIGDSGTTEGKSSPASANEEEDNLVLGQLL
ncbi:hypothetical protein JKF63_01992 [Porcisia hertigi]|uniref:Wings apart-like protein C-terminal domain-containing protein n=1 Tax=Porcisia hertigi TaxID=2761500 RepID=A0A836H5R4_9TRYP|nr:hypothetical protein JKF63_01992 [Porcisia hertigi]